MLHKALLFLLSAVLTVTLLLPFASVQKAAAEESITEPVVSEESAMDPESLIFEKPADYTGVAKASDGKWYRLVNGAVDYDANSIYKNEYGWWKCTNGVVTFDETGVFKNEHGWWRVVNSKVNFNANEIYKNQYGWWKTNKGKVTFKENGIFKNQYGWWKVRNSKVDFQFTGIASNSYGTWYLENGKVRFDRYDPVVYKHKLYSVNGGKASLLGMNFLQVDSPWSDRMYGKEAISTSGCGILSIVNAVYNLNECFLEPTEVADWAYACKYYNSTDFGGISNRDIFTKASSQFGKKAHFKYAGHGKDIKSDTLLKHLKNGGTAIFHVNSHYVTAIGYDSKTGMYRILDSFPGYGTSNPSTKRTTHAEGDWLTAKQLSESWMKTTEFWMYSET